MAAYSVPACITLRIAPAARIGMLVMKGQTQDHATFGTYAPTQFFVAGVTEDDERIPLYAWRRDVPSYSYGVPYTWHHTPDGQSYWSIEVPIGFCLKYFTPLKTIEIRVDQTGPGNYLDETISFVLYPTTDQPVCVRSAAESNVSQQSAYQKALQDALQKARETVLQTYDCRRWFMHARDKSLSFLCPDDSPSVVSLIHIAHPDRTKINGLREHMRKYLIELEWNCQ